MPQRELTILRASCLASAVLGLGACATLPPGHDGGAVARPSPQAEDGLVDRTFGVTRTPLGFEPNARTPAEEAAAADASEELPPGTDDSRPLLDMVDLAMLEEDAPPPAPSSAGASPAAASAPASDDVIMVAAEDHLHEVGSRETLWDIAKLTTGDANNWHVIADVNDLAPDAAVYPGQQLLIPADLVRPALVAAPTALPAGGGAGDVAAEVPEERIDDATTAVALPLPALTFELGAGETLWDFAKRTTGDATNWRAIADANAFDDEQATRVFEGQTILVPEDLVNERPAPAPTANGADDREARDAADAVAASAGTPDGTTAEVAVDTAAVGAVDATATGTAAASPVRPTEAGTEPTTGAGSEGVPEVKVAVVGPSVGVEGESDSSASPARPDGTLAGLDETRVGRAVETTFRETPARGAELAASVDMAAARKDRRGEGTPEEIMVSGTYYPKAVYNEANFSSSLLMRVSPGTTLQVSRAVGPWYEVETERGIGYVHARDIR